MPALQNDDRSEQGHRGPAGLRRDFQHEITAGSGDQLSPYLRESEIVPDHGRSLDLVCRWVVDALGRLEGADGHDAVAALRHAQVSRERQWWARKEVYARVVDVGAPSTTSSARRMGAWPAPQLLSAGPQREARLKQIAGRHAAPPGNAVCATVSAVSGWWRGRPPPGSPPSR